MKNPLDNFCPVPRDQRPFYQYLLHKEFFNSSKYNDIISCKKEIIKTFLLFFSISCFSFFLRDNLNYKNLLEICLLNFILMIIFYSYILINYNLISTQLFKSKILYEESTWFDINIWVKSVSAIRHERLINEYKIRPNINKLKQILIFLSLSIIITLFFLIIF